MEYVGRKNRESIQSLINSLGSTEESFDSSLDRDCRFEGSFMDIFSSKLDKEVKH